MVKKGKLTLNEKAAIQGYIGQECSAEEIASKLDRSENIVSKYIDGELVALHEAITTARVEAAEKPTKPTRYSTPREGELHPVTPSATDNEYDAADEATILLAYKRLKQAGLQPHDIEKVLKKALEAAEIMDVVYKDADKLYTACIKQMKAGEFMIKQTQGGGDGVAIMTPAASQRMDGPKPAQPSRTVRNNVWKPRG